jgi:hypothetical protein
MTYCFRLLHPLRRTLAGSSSRADDRATGRAPLHVPCPLPDRAPSIALYRWAESGPRGAGQTPKGHTVSPKNPIGVRGLTNGSEVGGQHLPASPEAPRSHLHGLAARDIVTPDPPGSS